MLLSTPRLIVAGLADLLAQVGVVDDHETPMLDVETRRRLDRGLEQAVDLFLAEPMVRVELLDGAALVDGVEGIHGVVSGVWSQAA